MIDKKQFIGRAFITTVEVAALCDVNRATVVRWIQAGELIAERTPGGRYRVRPQHLLKLCEEKKIYLSSEPRNGVANRPDRTRDFEERKTPTAPHVLVIDDDLLARQVVHEALTLSGYHVTLADNGYVGLDIILKDYTVQLVILDLLMPGINGLDTLRDIKRLRPDLPIVIVSGFIDYHCPNGTDSLCGKVDLVLQKPFDIMKFPEQCRHLLSTSRQSDGAQTTPTAVPV